MSDPIWMIGLRLMAAGDDPQQSRVAIAESAVAKIEQLQAEREDFLRMLHDEVKGNNPDLPDWMTGEDIAVEIREAAEAKVPNP